MSASPELIEAWVNECVIRDDKSESGSSEAYKSFLAWTTGKEIGQVSQKCFVRKMKALGFASSRTALKRTIWGMKLKCL